MWPQAVDHVMTMVRISVFDKSLLDQEDSWLKKVFYSTPVPKLNTEKMRKENMKSSRIDNNSLPIVSRQLGKRKPSKIVAINKLIARISVG